MSSSSPLVPLELATPQGPLELRLYDHQHELVTKGFGSLERRVRPGLYRLEIDAGTVVEEHFLTVGPSGVVNRELRVEMASAAPVEGTSTFHEYHAYPAQRLSRQPHRSLGHGGRLVVFVRSMDVEAAQRSPVNVHGLSLVDAQQRVLAQGESDFEQPPGEGWAGFSVNVEPGGYALRLQRPQRNRQGTAETIDQSLWVEEGWTTLVFVPYRQRVGLPEPEFGSVHMVRIDAGFEPYERDAQGANLALEIALSGLRQGRAVLPQNLEELMLRGKFENPMLGIVGALVLLQADTTNWRLFRTVRGNLERLVPRHPDLCALRVMAKDKRADDSESRVPIAAWPPMLHACYRGLIERDSAEERRIIAEDSVADLAAPRLLAQGPWTQWRSFDAASRNARSAEVEQKLSYVLQQVRAASTGARSSESLERLHTAWLRAIAQAEAPPTIKSRPAPSGAAATSAGFGARRGEEIETAATPEEVRVASYLETLVAQAAAFDLPLEESALDVRSLSDQVGLPRATVRRALKGLARRGFDWNPTES